MEENLIIDLFDNIDNQIFDCDTVKINDECEMHKYVTKDGCTFDVPAFTSVEKTLEMIKPLHLAFERDLPENDTQIEEFCHQILDNLQAYFILKEFVRYTNFHYGDKRITGLDNDVISAGKYVNNLLSMAADLSPIWWWKEAEKYPKLIYYGANPYNILGWDHKYDCYIPEPARNVITERNIMLDLSSSETPISLTEDKMVESIYELRNAKKEYNRMVTKIKH